MVQHLASIAEWPREFRHAFCLLLLVTRRGIVTQRSCVVMRCRPELCPRFFRTRWGLCCRAAKMFTFGGVDKTQYRFPDLHECSKMVWAGCVSHAVPHLSQVQLHTSALVEGILLGHSCKASTGVRWQVATMSVQPSARTFHKTVVHEAYTCNHAWVHLQRPRVSRHRATCTSWVALTDVD